MIPVHGFPPVANASARILILGSMPGRKSLDEKQYYANPNNAFWKLMGDFFDAGPALPYEQRKRRLKESGVALWDVIASCERTGSLDSAIAPDFTANDFQNFFANHRNITRVFFNGAKAEHCFRKQVLPTLIAQPLQFTRLPSTSPAHATHSYAQKRTAWQVIA